MIIETYHPDGRVTYDSVESIVVDQGVLTARTSTQWAPPISINLGEAKVFLHGVDVKCGDPLVG